MSRHNLYCEIGSYCLDKSNFFWSRIWIKLRRNDFNPMIMYFLTANFHKRKVINGLSQLSKNSAITKADINWHTIIRPRDQWKLLQCGLRTRHLASFFVPTAEHLTSKMSQPLGISDPRKKEMLCPGVSPGGRGHGAVGFDWCTANIFCKTHWLPIPPFALFIILPIGQEMSYSASCVSCALNRPFAASSSRGTNRHTEEQKSNWDKTNKRHTQEHI